MRWDNHCLYGNCEQWMECMQKHVTTHDIQSYKGLVTYVMFLMQCIHYFHVNVHYQRSSEKKLYATQII